MSKSTSPILSISRDGEHFDELDQNYLSGTWLFIGSGTIGKKVKVDCRYLWQDSQWGVYGRGQSPAGIVYIDISITQPEGYWLDHASVYVTLSEKDDTYALQRPRGEKSYTHGYRGYYDVQMTEHFGPQLLIGPKTSQKRDKSFRLLPKVVAGGIQVGGFGYEQTKSQELSSRWVFKGKVIRPEGHFEYKTLRWDFHGNHFDFKRHCSQEYHTGFTFEHNRRPIYMRVEVEGKLRSRTPRIKNEWLCFSSSRQTGGNSNLSTLTRMVFDYQADFSKCLDSAAKGLNEEMQRKNLQRAGLEIPEIRVLDAEAQLETEQTQNETEEESATADDEIVSALLQQLDDEDSDDGVQPIPSSSSMAESTLFDDEHSHLTTAADGGTPSPAPSVTTLVGTDEEKHDKLGHLQEHLERLNRFPSFTVLLKIFCFIVTYMM